VRTDENVPVRAHHGPPAGYAEAGRVVLAGNRQLLLGMNVGALVLLLLCCAGTGTLFGAVRPELLTVEATFGSPGQALARLGPFAAGALVTPLLVILVHEALHGAGFWWYTRARPAFGWNGWYAFATAPGWCLTRGQMMVVGLAPLIVITLGGLVLASFAPKPLAILSILAVVVNAAGACGDLYLVGRLLRLPGAVLVEDQHDRITWYLPAPT
jgi:putative zincin peptidase